MKLLSFDNTKVFGYLESARWVQYAPHAVELQGWCVVRDTTSGPWIQIEVYIGEHLLCTAPPLYRPDVAKAHSNSPHAGMSGFTAHLPWTETDSELSIKLRNGQGDLIALLVVSAAALPGMGVITSDYPIWSISDKLNRTRQSERIHDVAFSLIVPVYLPPLEVLRACLESICSQSHPHWNVYVVDDSGGNSGVQALLQSFASKDDRFEIITNPSNQGIARATNLGIERARHGWLVFLDHDDKLHSDSLSILSDTIAVQPEVELIYSDEEKICAEGQPREPFFKPGWSPIFAEGVMYPGHLLCVRTALVLKVGGVDPVFNGIQDFELFLRLSEHTQKITHIPQTLYQWRMIPGSSAAHGDIKGEMESLQIQAVQSHLMRRSRRAVAKGLGGHRVILEPPEDYVVPSFTTIAVDPTQIKHPKTLPQASENEWAVIRSSEIELIDDASLRRLIFHAEDNPETITAPLLLSRDGRILESGCTVTSTGRLTRIMFGFDTQADGSHGTLRCHREVGTTSAELLVTSASRWNEIVNAAQDPKQAGKSLPELILEQSWRVVVIANSHATHRLPLGQLSRKIHSPIQDKDFTDRYWNSRYDANFADYRRIPNNPTELRCHIESGLPPRTHDGRIRILGWCIAPANRRVSGVRIKMNRWVIEGRCQNPRPDVTQAFPYAASQTPGFELRVELPPGKYQVDLQIRLDDQPTWHSLQTRDVEVCPIPPLKSFLKIDREGRDLAFTLGLHPRHPPKKIEFPELSLNYVSSKWPKITLVTPSYQQGEFLRQALDSISSSRIEGLEHIVQDGGSTDGSVDFLKSHPLPHRRWVSDKDNGQAHAIMLGFAQTDGDPDDIMAWLNADDYYVPGAIDYIRQYFATHPDVDLVYGNRIVVDTCGREINRWFLPPHDKDVLCLNDFVPQETMFWRRKIWNKVGGLDPKFQFALDWDFLLRCQAAGAKIIHLPEFLGCFRVHPDQKSSTQIDSIGQIEIEELRARSFSPPPHPDQISASSILQSYLKMSRQLRDDATSARPS